MEVFLDLNLIKTGTKKCRFFTFVLLLIWFDNCYSHKYSLQSWFYLIREYGCGWRVRDFPIKPYSGGKNLVYYSQTPSHDLPGEKPPLVDSSLNFARIHVKPIPNFYLQYTLLTSSTKPEWRFSLTPRWQNTGQFLIWSDFSWFTIKQFWTIFTL